MQETKVIIERVRGLNQHFQHLELAVDESLTKLKPGQSLLARPEDGWQPYLREHWWPVNIVEDKLIVERPTDSFYEPGQVVDVLGVVGQPLRFRRTLRNVLLMAYNTPPTPLLMTIPWLLGSHVSVTLVLLGTAVEYETGHLSSDVEIIHGDADLSWPDRVMTLGWADQVFVTVAQDDEHQRFGEIWQLFNELRNDVPTNYVFGVFNPTLPCGVGGCHSCMIRTKQGMNLVCTEGPAFDLSQVILS